MCQTGNENLKRKSLLKNNIKEIKNKILSFQS